MSNENALGKLIRQLRGDLSLREFALKCEVSHTTIDNLEKGIDFRTGKPTQVKMATLQKIADACDLPLSYILNEAKMQQAEPSLSDPSMSKKKRKLMEWAQTVPEDKVEPILQALQSILEALQ
jgi:transcriptional regulator with XRE-family HTH domain